MDRIINIFQRLFLLANWVVSLATIGKPVDDAIWQISRRNHGSVAKLVHYVQRQMPR